MGTKNTCTKGSLNGTRLFLKQGTALSVLGIRELSVREAQSLDGGRRNEGFIRFHFERPAEKDSSMNIVAFLVGMSGDFLAALLMFTGYRAYNALQNCVKPQLDAPELKFSDGRGNEYILPKITIPISNTGKAIELSLTDLQDKIVQHIH